MFIKKAIAAAMVLGATGFASQAMAETATATFQVKMTIVKSCSVATSAASDINLGLSVQPTATNQTGNGAISVTCSKTTPYKLGLRPSTNGTDNGTGAMASTTNPTGNTDKVPYTLYSNPGLTTVWGNTIDTNTVPGTGSGSAQSHTVYARNTNANFTPDSYADTVTVTVTY